MIDHLLNDAGVQFVILIDDERHSGYSVKNYWQGAFPYVN